MCTTTVSTIGFIGAGNRGFALARNLRDAGLAPRTAVLDPVAERWALFVVAGEAGAVCRGADATFLAVKPQDVQAATAALEESGALIISILAGVSRAALGADAGQQGLAPEVGSALSVQTALGTALPMQRQGMAPAALVDMVSSTGGTTVGGRRELEAGAVRTALERTVAAATVWWPGNFPTQERTAAAPLSAPGRCALSWLQLLYADGAVLRPPRTGADRSPARGALARTGGTPRS